MSQASATNFLSGLRITPLFLLNMLGRPDYWAPYSHWDLGDDGKLVACGIQIITSRVPKPCGLDIVSTNPKFSPEFFCQHPRWNLQVQGAPCSVYMRHDIPKNQTIYIVSHKQGDTSLDALKKIMNTAMRTASDDASNGVFLDDPFDLHVLLSTLSFEASKHHVKRFQRFMWTQVRKNGLKPRSCPMTADFVMLADKQGR